MVKSRDIALLAIAVFLTAVFFLKEFYTSKEPTEITPASSAGQTVFEVEDPSGNSKVYVLPKKKPEGRSLSSNVTIGDQESSASGGVKSGSKITINKNGSATKGRMSGEKHLIFSIPLNINEATAQDFEALPGIGPKLAEKVIETRKALGGFKSIKDLKKVKGIGDKKFEKIREMVAVD
ncbi:MAG: hypothetical protein A2X87_05585 [Deltaproteobacteria bacterium GWC2_42_51]|nr:MAG: hypothetical protein A2056_01875 [Deltaproteobacteria bacterium GWA2_42_85]OGP31190.1 MAG: hypothetical protein A2X87_05585 [Deltaproteobacteria bacterium GWC2_42_51]OGP43382.1 MAG: hypothetical protein A2090_03915 [Deltaproteobacteria bacterium GWD2_42_10]OGP46119.1 MAG: hypothetical protein A2022_00945 [Deltaproteobacteria bacterium GWF2_42_12]OGQ24664.1 MAG: hypothetical protein A3D29_00180 [Deltaproteobacteria bacterium RIFCSPHIGHO2_02_FULL_42_44]OGQ37257.1 MAG: hypothetical protei